MNGGQIQFSPQHAFRFIDNEKPAKGPVSYKGIKGSFEASVEICLNISCDTYINHMKEIWHLWRNPDFHGKITDIIILSIFVYYFVYKLFPQQ